MFKAKQAYLQTQVTTTSQGELVVMLYDGAIKFLHQAKERIEAKDFAEKGILISKALDIIQELDSSLNMEQGGEISKNLHSLYIFAQNQMLKANLKMDTKPLDEVADMLASLREAFASIANTPEAIEAQKQAPEQTPVNVNQFRDNGPFGLNEAKRESAAPVAPANASVRTKAYQQQASAFAPASLENGAATIQPAAQAVPESPVAPAGQSSQASQPAQTAASSSASGQPVQHATQQSAYQALPQAQVTPPHTTATPAQTKPTAPNPQAVQALNGFASQMINNSLYKKMALNNSLQAAEK